MTNQSELSFITFLNQMTFSDIDSFKQELVQKNIRHYNDYLIFEPLQIEKNFQRALMGLLSEITLSPDYLDTHEITLVAMTIDGDFICANNTDVWLFSKNLLVADMEHFPLTIKDFFLAAIQGTVTSNYLSF